MTGTFSPNDFDSIRFTYKNLLTNSIQVSLTLCPPFIKINVIIWVFVDKRSGQFTLY